MSKPAIELTAPTLGDPVGPEIILSSYLRRVGGEASSGNGNGSRHAERADSTLEANLETHAEFLTSISHQLRTPLTVILGLAVTLEQYNDRFPADVVGELSERIAHHARRLERLVLDLLDMDRLTRNGHRLVLDRVDLASLPREVAAYTELLDRHPLTVSAGDVVVRADRAKLERMLESLFANVSRHTPPGTPVWVTVARRDGEAVLAVEDGGPGFPEDLGTRLCEPFVSRSPAHDPGAGLGLALVDGFARLHGGGVRLGTGRGGGASVEIVLPLEGPQDHEDPGPRPVRAGPRKGGRE